MADQKDGQPQRWPTKTKKTNRKDGRPQIWPTTKMADYKENRPQRRPPHEDGHQQEDRPQRWSPMRTANNRKTDHKDGRHKDGRLPGRPTTKMADDTRINGHIFVNRWWKYSEGIQKGENRLCGDCEIIWPGVYAAIENCWHESMCNVYLDSADSNNFRVMSPPPPKMDGWGGEGGGDVEGLSHS